MNTEPIHIISLGAGVQSSTMALMAAAGDITPMPTCAIFSDTQNEEQLTYEWLEQLEKELTFPVYKVTKGDLRLDFLKALKTEHGRCGQPPFFVRNPKDNSIGVLWRECTVEYKLQVIRRKSKSLMQQHDAKHILQWIGISLDEAHRMKDSGVKYITNVYPLVDRGISRSDCLKWLKQHHFPIPPKSSCFFCPYHSESFWLEMKQQRPKEFARAVQFEAEITQLKSKCNGANIRGNIFLHRSAVPLDQAVFDPHEAQLNLFGNECEGMCGV